MSIDVQAPSTADAATETGGWRPTVGQEVIAWNQDAPIVYGGPADDPRFEQVAFGYGEKPRLFCDPDRVAPADAPQPDAKDPRIQVTKSRRPYPWLPGNWCLELPKMTATWHRTKRDAVADGQRRLAIVDWHAKHKHAPTAAVAA